MSKLLKEKTEQIEQALKGINDLFQNQEHEHMKALEINNFILLVDVLLFSIQGIQINNLDDYNCSTDIATPNDMFNSRGDLTEFGQGVDDLCTIFGMELTFIDENTAKISL